MCEEGRPPSCSRRRRPRPWRPRWGPHKATIHRNHGLFTVGHSVDEAAWWFITMERSCQAQLLAEAAGTPVLIDDEGARYTRDHSASHGAGGSRSSRCGTRSHGVNRSCSTDVQRLDKPIVVAGSGDGVAGRPAAAGWPGAGDADGRGRLPME